MTKSPALGLDCVVTAVQTVDNASVTERQRFLATGGVFGCGLMCLERVWAWKPSERRISGYVTSLVNTLQ